MYICFELVLFSSPWVFLEVIIFFVCVYVCERPATFIDISQNNIKQLIEHTGGQEYPFPDLCPSYAIVQNQTNTVRASSKRTHPTHASCHNVLDHFVQAMILLLEPQTIILAISWHLNSPTQKEIMRGNTSSPSPLSLYVRAPYLFCLDWGACCPAGNGGTYPNLLSVLAIS